MRVEKKGREGARWKGGREKKEKEKEKEKAKKKKENRRDEGSFFSVFMLPQRTLGLT